MKDSCIFFFKTFEGKVEDVMYTLALVGSSTEMLY